MTTHINDYPAHNPNVDLRLFKPQLCPNEQPDISKLRFPLLASFKYDGIRAIFINGKLLSRSLKPLENKSLNDRFHAIKQYSKDNNVILDGEFYTDSVPFNDLSGIIRSDDKELPEDLCFYCFDYLTEENKTFMARVKDYNHARDLEKECKGYFHPVTQKVIGDIETLEASFQFALEHGFEGLILRNPTSHYKFGRASLKQDIAYKMKPYVTFDAKIINVVQATEAREGSEKTINELGRSVTSQKKADRVLINKAAVFTVLYEGKELGVTIALTDIEKEEIWVNKDKYLGRWIEYKGMLVGSKDLPRHPVFLRYRDDKC